MGWRNILRKLGLIKGTEDDPKFHYLVTHGADGRVISAESSVRVHGNGLDIALEIERVELEMSRLYQNGKRGSVHWHDARFKQMSLYVALMHSARNAINKLGESIEESVIPSEAEEDDEDDGFFI